MKKGVRKIVVLLVLSVLTLQMLGVLLPGVVNAGPVFVVPDDYGTIQEAVNAADSGTTIYVKAGVYNEDIDVPNSKSQIVIVGDSALNTVLNGYFSATSLGTNSISIESLTINGNVTLVGEYYCLYDCSLNSYTSLSTYNGTIENNRCNGSLILVSGYDSPASLNIVRNNRFYNSGIIIAGWSYFGGAGGCSNNLITENTIIDASVGITEGQDISTSFDTGENVISRNTIRNCSIGILSENSGWIWAQRGTNITQNTIESCASGVVLANVSGMWLWQNNFVTNGVGLDLTNVNITVVWGNYFLHNVLQTGTILGGGLAWDNGYPTGYPSELPAGNYWNDYGGADVYHGPNQDLLGADGIGDTPYLVGGQIALQDHYPLMVANQRIAVSNTVEDTAPPDPWTYTITDASTNALVTSFYLPAAGGGSVSTYSEPVGKFYSITQGGVTQSIEPIRGNISAQDFYAYNVSIGSGFAPYMETGKSKIYLYEDTTTGALSLIIHHNKYLGPVNFFVNMTLTGLPTGTDALLQDDPTPEDFLGLLGGGVAFGYWSGGNFSDGGILGGLEYPESIWDITAQILYTEGISAWEYQTASGPITLNMAEPLVIRSFTLRIGGQYMIAQHSKFGYDTSIIVNGTVVPTVTENQIDMTLVNLGPDDTVSVVFIEIPVAEWGKTASASDTFPPVTWTYNIPCRVPIPIQAALNPDINKDGAIDLVRAKPTVILVNLSDVRAAAGGNVQDNEYVRVAISDTMNLFNNLVSPATQGQLLAQNNITIFYVNAPSVAGNDDLTATISKAPTSTGPWTPIYVNTKSVTIKDTSGLSLYYAALQRATDYGTESQTNYANMVNYATNFINATYPLPNITMDTAYKNLPGNQSTPGSTLALLKDCQWLAQLAKLQFPTGVAVGIGIGPNTTVSKTYLNYFAYHGATDTKGNVAVGVSFGPGTRGVVVMDGYYTAAAHELAHTFNLYYGVPEEYLTDYPGKTTNGFSSATNQWRTGYDFMGLAPYKRTDVTWVNTASTYEYLFRNFTKTLNDPPILLVSGIIYKDGTVEFPLTWYHLQEGTPDTVPPGDFALRFVDSNNNIIDETSFDASFFMQIDPGMSVGENLPDVSGFGKVDTDFAGFSFAIAYPQGTAAVELVNNTDPKNPVVMGTVTVPEIVFLPATTETQTGTQGSNGWYTSDVNVTLTATATLGVREIQYTLDGTSNVVQAATATFTVSSEGTHSLSYWAIDNSGNTELPQSQSIKIDKTPATVTLTVPQPILHQTATATWMASDSISGVDGPASGTVVIDTSSVGPKTVTVTVKDIAGNSITVTKTCSVTYAFSGFLEPINNDGSSIFKLKSTVPVKFQLRDAQGNLISTAVAKIYLTKISNKVLGDDLETGSTSAATEGNLFRYADDLYIFNLGTKTLSAGTWQISVVLDDGTTHTVLISLR